MATMDGFDQIAEHQGWNEQTQLDLLREYLNAHGDVSALADFARMVMERENEAADDEMVDGWTG